MSCKKVNTTWEENSSYSASSSQHQISAGTVDFSKKKIDQFSMKGNSATFLCLCGGGGIVVLHGSHLIDRRLIKA